VRHTDRLIWYLHPSVSGFAGTISRFPSAAAIAEAESQGDSVLGSAFKERRSNIQVEGRGEVTLLLADDQDGNRHQRFLLRLRSGQTLLIVHSIDLAPRVTSIKVRDVVSFHGEYEWNAKGGVIHWTHRDPAGRHEAGWLKHKDRIYQ
jgi:hypothetical protein